ncbi:MAG: hypothetical protein Q8J92_05255 [Parvibaculum sp.]|nr:hypothetical protein [Parvibaculum sp.]
MIGVDYWQLGDCLSTRLGVSPNASSVDLLNALSVTRLEYASELQNIVEKIIKGDAIYRKWQRNRLLLRDAPFFRIYRCTNRTYNDAALRFDSGDATPKDRKRVEGLDGEISRSPCYLSAGHTVFYGLGLPVETSHSAVRIGHYLSTTFSPVVAMNHALRKSSCVFNSSVTWTQRPTVAMIQVQNHTQFMFNPVTRRNREYEALLSRGLELQVSEHHRIKKGLFDFVVCQLV